MTWKVIPKFLPLVVLVSVTGAAVTFHARVACACLPEPDVEEPRPDLVYSEERQQGYSLWLRYEAEMPVSRAQLHRHAQARADALCIETHQGVSGSYRYLSVTEFPEQEPDGENERHGIELAVECLSDVVSQDSVEVSSGG